MNGFNICNGEKLKIYVSEKESEAVKIAAKNLCKDLKKVCNADAELTSDAENSKILIGTYGIEDFNNHSDLKDKNDNLIWEAYSVEEKSGRLYIAGSDRRGTIYGIYELCESIGVSPWYYFADVPVKTRENVFFESGFKKTDYPSVRYRGIFINDEEELEAWAKSHLGEKTIGPKTYKYVFELLLRLKANYIWPAMHVNAFNMDLENGRLADTMGIVVGTSHCDMLLRSNQNEWKPWLEKKGYTDVEYDYSIEGRNRDIIREYWRESVEQNLGYEVCYTVGMRGIHDSGFITREITDNSSLSDEEKLQAKVKLLGEVIRDQRKIIDEVTENREAPQTFVPYKEVLSLYDMGLEVPDDVTLIWANDNFGYMRRYPSVEEQKRPGGSGLYYHSSYWATAGMSYLFVNSTPIAHTRNELKKAYENGIQRMWVLNVGAIKPLEQDIEFFLRYAWEINRNEETTADTDKFTELWIDNNFSGSFGKEIAQIYNIYAQVTNVRKLEHMKSGVFSQTAYGGEWARRMLKYEDIFNRTLSIHNRLPENEREAFFQMFAMKIYASYFINASFYYADRSKLMYDRKRMREADECIALSRKMDDYKRRLICYYNKIMCGGKWDNILTPEGFPPPCMALYPACKPALVADSDLVETEKTAEPDSSPIFKSESGYAENDGYISISAEHYSSNSGWKRIKNIGRFEGDVMEADAGTLEYELNFTSSGKFLLELYRFPTLNSTGRIRFGISIDENVPVALESFSNDEWCGDWKKNVMNNVEKLYLDLPEIKAGKHILSIHAIDKYAAFSKIVIYTGDREKSNLGPEESYHAEWNKDYARKQYCFEPDMEALESICLDLFTDAVPDLPEVIYVGKKRWAIQDRLFLRNDVVKQYVKGVEKYTYDRSGNKNVFDKFGNGVFCEENGVIAFGAEYVLENSENAYLTADKNGVEWEHTQSETDGGTGIAMYIAPEDLSWEDGTISPSMNYKISCSGGKYNIWLLLKYDDGLSARLFVGLDGNIVPLKDMCEGGNFFNYGTKQHWVWMLVTERDIEAGEHIFSINARASQLRVDRIYITKTEENPPIDCDWKESKRK